MDVCGIRSMVFNSAKKSKRDLIATYSKEQLESLRPERLKHIWIYLNPDLQTDRDVQVLLPCEVHHNRKPLPAIKDCLQCFESGNIFDFCNFCKRSFKTNLK